jgi:uncharacterized protein (TIGR02246 family)
VTENAEVDAIVDLYFTLLTRWNDRDASGMAALLTDDGQMVGFDGSLMEGPQEVAAALGAIFSHHPTAAYVAKVKRVEMLGPQASLLRAMVSMVPRGLSDISPMVNAVQTLVALRVDGCWRVAEHAGGVSRPAADDRRVLGGTARGLAQARYAGSYGGLRLAAAPGFDRFQRRQGHRAEGEEHGTVGE